MIQGSYFLNLGLSVKSKCTVCPGFSGKRADLGETFSA